MTDFFDFLKSFTQARVGLKHSGYAVSTKEHLDFQWAHAQARDSIHAEWDLKSSLEALSDLGFQTQTLSTQVRSRVEYLARPDLGRVLDASSVEFLKKQKSCEIFILLSNGLSSEAIHRHAVEFLRRLGEGLGKRNFVPTPVFLIPNARVALGDPIGDLLKSKLCLTVIGERPGLSSPDSMGLYLTYEPKVGKTDADRNCISNIRVPHGLSYEGAVHKTFFLIEEALRRRLSGVQLKDESLDITETKLLRSKS